MTELSFYSDEALKTELERRGKKAKLTKVNKSLLEHKTWPNSPIGIWKVTTEGDVECLSVTQLGVFEGHVADIAFLLAKSCYYSLNFQPAKELLPTSKDIKKKSVNIQLDIESGTWDMDGDERASAVQVWLESKPTEIINLKAVEIGQYYASVNVSRMNELKPKSKEKK